MIRNGHAGFGRGSRKRTTRLLAEALPQPIRPAIRHARSRRAAGECVVAAGRPPRHGTARATPTRIANAAIPALSRRNGHGNGFAKQCARGERATALRRPRTIGRARTHVGAAAKRSNDYMPENGPRRPPSSVCTGLGRRPSATPSAAHERLGVKCRWHRDPRLHLVMCEQERRRSPRRFCHSCVGEARRRELAVVCQQPPVVRSPQFGDRRRSRPPVRRDHRNRGEPAARCPTKAGAPRLTPVSRGSGCASSGLCSRPPRATRQLSAWGEGITAPAGARAAEAIEPDDCHPGVARREATDVAASRCRQRDLQPRRRPDERRGHQRAALLTQSTVGDE